MKILPIIILILLLAPISASAFQGVCGDYSAGRLDCLDYQASKPCTGYIDFDGTEIGQCYPDYCCVACEELWDLEDYCPLKVCCLVIKISRWLYFIGYALAMIIIIWSGITYMTAAGDETRTTKAKKLLLYGLVGVLIILASGFILGTIVGFIY